MKNIYPIEVKKLKFLYNNEKILDDVNIKIERGKFYSIIGPNGSGKTTLIKNICKILEGKNGHIFINEKDINKMDFNSISKSISVVSQDTNIDFDFSVMDIVLMGRTPYIKAFSTETYQDLNIAKEAMEFLDVWRLKDKNIRSLSGGERQRVLIARAICQNTDIILLDEPISHLDIKYQIELLNKLKSLNINKKITVIAILHDLNLASTYSDYIVLMNKGKIVDSGTSEQVLTKENIKNVYNIKVDIVLHPTSQKPYIIPLF
ncbi:MULTISPECIES: ABC transporter ATP-binding protein [Clostridium]|uniref:Iron compound ABC transporter, ATP-binding protein n=1 Tax=Clostridium novyi (strain NT) TaxID=386415 RepID=A0Q0K7_CLONN|nr:MULTISPECIES: ABC transporter ATP-binding protein [Clostridium]ABK61002.1 iron compound ABC transporter, ATP-binding protein [Clostridium novyi NT]KEH85416.1 ABC transporter [Clostridium novyi A str. NCTC 538]KEH85525.1 ABC transporter [Clostridium novyi A str. 4540]KEH88133.1 ABC transporter [Clostridium novyi A str. BKT29909]KEH91459.1 ABC transporter [Clostridium novyi A str. GD211209]